MSAAEPFSLYRELAERLLTHETRSGEGSTEQGMEALIRVQEKLQAQLAQVVGETGLEALITRSIRLSKLPLPQGTEGTWPPNPLAQLNTWLHSQPAQDAHDASKAWLMAFLGLLSSFIGDALTLRLLDQAWSGEVAFPRPSTEKK